MLRIHFTGQDLARTRIAAAPDPMWELSLSIHQLRLRDSNPLLTSWKQIVSRSLHPGGRLRAEVELPLALNPARGYFPDFLTPIEGIHGFEAGLQAILGTSGHRLRMEIGLFSDAHSALAPTVAGVGRGEAGMLDDLGTAMRRYHGVALAPVWDVLCAAVEADRNRRARQLVDGGWAEVLDNLHPCARFANGIMEVSVWGQSTDRDLHLGGRGLLLVPSYFKESRQLLVLADVDLPPVLVYPIDQFIRVAAEAANASLAALIGRTRALVLQTAVIGGTTSDIARWLRVSPPAASKHLTVLRKSGLVNSTREQNAVFHTLTPLGQALLAAG